MAVGGAIKATFAGAEEGGQTPEPQPTSEYYNRVSTPNNRKIGADKAGAVVKDRCNTDENIQLGTNLPHIFTPDEIAGQPMQAHQAGNEFHLAAEVIAGELQGNKGIATAKVNATVIPGVAGMNLREDQAKAPEIKANKGLFGAEAGRDNVNGCGEHSSPDLKLFKEAEPPIEQAFATHKARDKFLLPAGYWGPSSQ